jgi:hypothetical protein
VLLLLMIGCVTQVEPRSWFVAMPSDVWMTRPVPCAYREVGPVGVQSWDASDLGPALADWLARDAADAIIDLTFTSEVVRLSYRQCDEVPTCTVQAGKAEATLHTAEGLAVRWVDGCVLEGNDSPDP